MKARWIGVFSVLILALGLTGVLLAQRGYPGGKVRPQKSGFYDFSKGSPDFASGVGSIQNITCTVGESTQPSIYAGNMLLDCDAETPHNETTVAADPNNPSHIIGGYHAYQLHFNGATLVERIVGTVSVSFDRGQNWREILPPITPYQFTGDPALAFNTAGRIYTR